MGIFEQRIIYIALLLSTVVGLAVPVRGEETPEEGDAGRVIAVVTHVDNKVDSISRSELARVFMKQQTTWPNGERCIPIDQRGDKAIRRAFSALVLQRSVYEMKRYWMQETMTGNAKPPVSLESAATVKKYLGKLKGAVAYIYEDDVDDSVKVLAVSDVKELARPEEVQSDPSDRTSQPDPAKAIDPSAEQALEVDTP